MKKKNLLALSALVLSLGLTVSSCAGAQGEKGDTGDKGDTGETGPQGPAGEPGQDGKTYVDVIVLPTVTNDGKIKQDKWAVEEGKNETVTFTFVPSDPEAEQVIVDFKINDTVVKDVIEPDADGNLTFTFTVDDSYKSVQVTNATFVTPATYASKLVYTHFAELKAKDRLLLGSDDGVEGEGYVKEFNSDLTTENDKDYKGAALEDTSIFELAQDEVARINEELEGLEDDATLTEKVNLVKTKAADSIKSIDEAYAELVSDAKLAAKEEAESTSDEITIDTYKDADRTNDLNSANAAIDAATTLVDIAKIVNSTPTTGVKTGSFNTLISTKRDVLESLETAYNGVIKDEAWLNVDEEDEDSVEAYETFLAQLKAYGVENVSNPKEVYDSYVNQVSSATTFEKYSADAADGSYKKGQIVLKVEGVKAIENSVVGTKEAIAKAVINQYFGEIDNSAALASSSNVKVALKGVIEQAVADFENADTATNYISISRYISSGYETKDASEKDPTQVVDFANKETGLIGYVEAQLNASTYMTNPFRAERLSANINATLKAFSDEVTRLKKADETLAKVNAGTYTTGSGADAVTHYLTSEKVGGLEDVFGEVKPLSIPGSTEKYWEVTPTKTAVKGVTGIALDSTGDATNTQLNLDAHLNALKTAANTTNQAKTGLESAADVKEWQAAHIDDFAKIYKQMVSTYSGEQKKVAIPTSKGDTPLNLNKDNDGAVVGTFDISNHAYKDHLIIGLTDKTNAYPNTATKWTEFVTKDLVDKTWDELIKKAGTLDTVTTIAESINKNISLLADADSKLVEFLGKEREETTYGKVGAAATGLYASDHDYIDWLISGEAGKKELRNTSKLYDSFLGTSGIIAQILNGEAKSSDVTRWGRESNLKSVYEADIAAYAEVQKDKLQQVYQNLIVNNISNDEYEDLTLAYNTYVSYLGHKVGLDSNGNLVVDDKDGTNTTYLGKTMNSLNTWYSDALSALKNANAESPTEPTVSVETTYEETWQFQGVNVTAKNDESFKVVNGIAFGKASVMDKNLSNWYNSGTPVSKEGDNYVVLTIKGLTNNTKYKSGLVASKSAKLNGTLYGKEFTAKDDDYVTVVKLDSSNPIFVVQDESGKNVITIDLSGLTLVD